MVIFEKLLEEWKISRIDEFELNRYCNFFEQSYKENLEHAKATIEKFPRWSIISGYYAMHDITKLFLAKKHRIKIEKNVHETTIIALKEVLKEKRTTELMEKGYAEYLTLSADLNEAKEERVKAQYYTGSEFMKKQFKETAKEFFNEIVEKYINKILELLE